MIAEKGNAQVPITRRCYASYRFTKRNDQKSLRAGPTRTREKAQASLTMERDQSTFPSFETKIHQTLYRQSVSKRKFEERVFPASQSKKATTPHDAIRVGT